MKVGTAQFDITPSPGIELAGFAVRPQPSTGILDTFWAQAVCLEDGRERFLWLHLDSLGLDQALADRLRAQLGAELDLPSTRVLLSATHTHSGPAAMRLTGCGTVEPGYVSCLEEQCLEFACAASDNLEPCCVVSAQGRCELGVDRRPCASAHTDSRVGALGWRGEDGSFKADFLNYSMHPVCLRGSQVSGDWPGAAARYLTEQLVGKPLAFVSPGASGNINPPKVGVAAQQAQTWDRSIAGTVTEGLLATRPGAPREMEGALRKAATIVKLPLEPSTILGVEDYVAGCRADGEGHGEFDSKFRLAVETWRAAMLDRRWRGEPPYARAPLGTISFGPAALVTVNGEIFSRFTELAGDGADRPVNTVSCANGMMGYVPTALA